MNVSSRPIRILLLETDRALSTPVVNILHARSSIRVFDLVSVGTIEEAAREIKKELPDIVLLDLNPSEDSEMKLLTRLLEVTPQTPIVALLADAHQGMALSTIQKGAQSYLLASQVNQNDLPATILRTIERHVTQKALRESEERLRLLIENATDVIFILDRAGVVIYTGPSTERILKTPVADLTTNNFLDFVHRDDRLKFFELLEQAFETGQALPTLQFRYHKPDGDWLPMEGQGRIAPDSTGQLVCILNCHDITHRVKLEEELRRLSLRDELTGLHNRRSFVTCLEQQLKLSQRSKLHGIYLLFIDLDGFKKINDSFGHKEGDHALIEAARILKATFRDADLVARLGGDEFVVFLTDDLEGVHVDSLKKRLQESVEAWNNRENRAYQLGMSVGVVHNDLQQKRPVEDLLNEADELMYKQKREKKRAVSHPEGIADLEQMPLPSADSVKN